MTVEKLSDLGWLSRKFLVAVSTFLVPFVVASVAYFTDRMSADQWLGFVQVQAPTILGLYGFQNVLQKRVQAP